MRNAAVFLEVADWLPDPLVLVRRSGDIVAANRAASRQLYFSPTPLSGDRLQAHVDGEYASVDAFVARCARTRGPLPGRIPLRLPDGTRVACRCNGGLFHEQSSEGPPLILLRIVRTDATASEFTRLNTRLGELRREMELLQRANEERLLAESQLMQAQKLESLGVLAGGIAHDFNNLLTGILGYIDLARTEIAPDSKAMPLLDGALVGAQRAAEVTQQMLAYSGKGRFVVEPLDISTLVSEMGRLLEISVSKKANVRYELARELPAVSGDAAQLRQVVMNLIINASEAIGDRQGRITISTSTLEADEHYLTVAGLTPDLAPGKYVVTEVMDNGIGMSEDTLRRLFDPFFTTKFTGRGLGLAAVLGIVRGHRGAIRVSSTLGEGSRFRIYLPALTTAPPAPKQEEGISTWKSPGRALVVDDEPAVRDLARRILQRMGYAVEMAPDGQAALDLFETAPESWDLVLLDMTMPQLDGRETFEAMRAIRAGVPTILMSGYNEQTATNRFVGEGIAGFLAKPFGVQQLTQIVQRVIERPRPMPPG